MNKHIEEISNLERLLRVRKLDIEKQGFDVATIFYGRESEEASIARYLVGEGYRKASDVAREIFEEIERLLDTYSASHHSIGEVCGESYFERGLEDAIAELRKKYESEGEE